MMGDTAPAWRQDPRRCGSNGAGKLGEPFLQMCFTPKRLLRFSCPLWRRVEQLYFPPLQKRCMYCGGMKSIELTQLAPIPTPSTWLLWRTFFVDDLQWPFGVLGMLTVLLVIMSSNEVLQSVAWRCKSKSMVSCQRGWNVFAYSLFPSCFLCILQLLHYLPKAFRNRLTHPSTMAAARESGFEMAVFTVYQVQTIGRLHPPWEAWEICMGNWATMRRRRTWKVWKPRGAGGDIDLAQHSGII